MPRLGGLLPILSRSVFNWITLASWEVVPRRPLPGRQQSTSRRILAYNGPPPLAAGSMWVRRAPRYYLRSRLPRLTALHHPIFFKFSTMPIRGTLLVRSFLLGRVSLTSMTTISPIKLLRESTTHLHPPSRGGRKTLTQSSPWARQAHRLCQRQ